MLSLSSLDEVLAPLLAFGLAAFRGAIPASACDEICEQLLASDAWQDLRFGEYRAGILSSLEESADVRALVNYSYEFPSDLECELKEEAGAFATSAWNVDVPGRSRMTAGCLREGMALGSHRDSNYGDTPRLATVVAYVSDGYGGGDLVFPDLSARFSPSKGDVLIFFAEHIHLVEQVTSGARYTGVFFLETKT